jgi:cobalt-precorrin 5A hydrolase/precorrin-3B C17-methyltransferase
MTGPVILVLGPSGLALADKIAALVPDAEIHGLARRVPRASVKFDDTMAHVRACFAAGRVIIGICASAILVRAIGPLLSDKTVEPSVIAVADDGSSVVPLIGGHAGGNDLARRIAEVSGGHAAITTAGDIAFAVALDAPPDGWVLANPGDAKRIMADCVAGAGVRIDPALDWLGAAKFRRQDDGTVRLTASIARPEPVAGELIYHPRRIVLGVGSDRGCPPGQMIALAEATLDEASVAAGALACVVSLDRKADEPAVHALAAHFGVPARFITAKDIAAVADLIPNPSDVVAREVGVPGVAEGAALAASGCRQLLVQKRKAARATCALAVADDIVLPDRIGRARGSLAVVGVGPGARDWRSGEVETLLRRASDWVGYGLYLDLVADLRHRQAEHRFALGDEEKRVRHALELAAGGRDVALVCSGDAGIYAMAALACEVMALDPASSGLSDGAHRVALTVTPGISAFQAAAARAGAPIGHDFCCISLSDLLTPWPLIERRIRAAGEGDFVAAFYNPKSMRRVDQLDRAISILRSSRPPDTPVIVASNLGRPAEDMQVVALQDFVSDGVDMLSIVIVGASSTRAFETGDGRKWVFTPRGYAAKREAAE